MNRIAHDVGEEVGDGDDESSHHAEVDVDGEFLFVLEDRLAQTDVDCENCRTEKRRKIACKHIVFYTILL